MKQYHLCKRFNNMNLRCIIQTNIGDDGELAFANIFLILSTNFENVIRVLWRISGPSLIG